MKTVALFDIDDVINVIPNQKRVHVTRSGWDKTKWAEDIHRVTMTDRHGKGVEREFKIVWNRELVEEINALPSIYGVDMFWLSTWNHDSGFPDITAGRYGDDHPSAFVRSNREFLSGMGFDAFDAVDAPGASDPTHYNPSAWWKYRAVEWVIENTDYQRIVWYDDLITKASGKALLTDYARSHRVTFEGVTVRQSIGLTVDEFDLVRGTW